MKISIASDHGGFELKDKVVDYLSNVLGYEVLDQGTNSLESVHYPLYAARVAKDVQNKNSDFGVLICTTGIGMSIMANKFKGIKAALITNLESSSLTREHNNSNVICIGARYTSVEDACKYIETFVNTDFVGGRHKIRTDMIDEVEQL